MNEGIKPTAGAAARVLVVDLNNFARYPSMSVGYLVAGLRGAGVQVDVFAPLMVGVAGVLREARASRLRLMAAKLNHRIATSEHHRVRSLRDSLAAGRASAIQRHAALVVNGIRDRLRTVRPDVVMISTYLMYRDVCEQICALCEGLGVPVLVGGPYFAQRDVAEDWIRLPGLTALAVGEVELELPSIVQDLLAGRDPARHRGVLVRGDDGRARGDFSPPLQSLSAVPHPDYSDFPWDRYPNRIVPIVTGRGCAWGACTFCSDVTSTAGRSFRSRTPEDVMSEIRGHHRRYGVTNFVFTDLKLNSDVSMWRAIAAGMQGVVPGARWIGAVHVGHKRENGLSARELAQAARNGCVRLTTGLETGSQRVANLMAKGTRVDEIGQFFHDANDAGISVRCTMVLGYPGETAEDVDLSTSFLERHSAVIERVSLNRLQVVGGTRLHHLLKRQPARFRDVQLVGYDAASARVEHHYSEMHTRPHRRAVMRLLDAVHQINSKPLSPHAREFDGVM